MPSLANPDPAIANAAYIELHDCAGWLFADESADMLERRRDALARLGALRPATILEAQCAAQVIALDLHRQDSLRLAAEHRNDVAIALRCRTNAIALSRQSLRLQAKLEAMQQARRTAKPKWNAAKQAFEPPEQDVLIPDRTAAGAPAAVPPATNALPAGPATPAAPAPDPTTPATGDIPPAVLAQAEHYATNNRMLAMRIRRAGGLTRQAIAGFRPAALPQDAAVVQALVSGASPTLAALDAPLPDRRAA